MVDDYTKARSKQDAIRANKERERVSAFHRGHRERYVELCEELGHDPVEDMGFSEAGGLEVGAVDSGIICFREEEAAKTLYRRITRHGMDLWNYPLDIEAALKAHKLNVPEGRKERVEYARILLKKYGFEPGPGVD